jgi:hypothetical protein
LFRITSKLGTFTHKCVQCGFVVQYTGINNNNCPSCNAEQRFVTKDRNTDVPLYYIFGTDTMGEITRLVYHMRKTTPG